MVEFPEYGRIQKQVIFNEKLAEYASFPDDRDKRRIVKKELIFARAMELVATIDPSKQLASKSESIYI